MNFLGIDFGTTKTLAARWDERAKSPRTIRLGRGGDAIPSTIHVDKKGEMNFGDDADDLRAIDFAGWKGRIKRDLGRGASVVLNGHSYRVVDLIARFLAYVLKRAEEECFHGTVDHAVITVPALYGPAEREELKQAIKQAGFVSFDILEEPVAAGCAFLADKVDTSLGNHVLVFDWGGGTLDLALVEHREGKFHLEPEWISGDKMLGGEDIDDSIVDAVDATLSTVNGAVDSQSDHNRLHIMRNLKEGKELLSRRVEHKFRLPYEQGMHEFLWTREEFEHRTNSTINQAIECLREHLQKIRSQGIEVDQVLLVGGASEIPAVRLRIERELGLKPIRWENSQTAVALGAVVRAAGIGTIYEPAVQQVGQKPPTVDPKFRTEIIGEMPGIKVPLDIQIRSGDFGVFAQVIDVKYLLQDEKNINETHVLLGPDLHLRNVSSLPLNRVKIEIHDPVDGRSNKEIENIPLIESAESIQLNPLQIEWNLTAGQVINISWLGCEEPIKYTTTEQDCAPPKQGVLPVFLGWKSGSFSGKVLQVFSVAERPLKNVKVEKEGGEAILESLESGQPGTVGWFQFSDSANLQTGQLITVSANGYRSILAVIKE